MARRPEQIGVDVVPQGLMLPVMHPPVGEDAEFNDWYDHEHAPARAAIPGFLTARRWRVVPGWDGSDALDPVRTAEVEKEPLEYLATFDLDELSVLDGEDYLGLRAKASDRERDITSRCVYRDRRVYASIPTPPETHWADLDICGPYLLVRWWEESDGDGPEAEKPYLVEHIAQAATTPGVRRVRLFERVDALGPGHFATLYDVDSFDVFHDTGSLVASDAHQRGIQMRLYRLWSRLDPPLR